MHSDSTTDCKPSARTVAKPPEEHTVTVTMTHRGTSRTWAVPEDTGEERMLQLLTDAFGVDKHREWRVKTYDGLLLPHPRY
jgi:hypothetical protein